MLETCLQFSSIVQDMAIALAVYLHYLVPCPPPSELPVDSVVQHSVYSVLSWEDLYHISLKYFLPFCRIYLECTGIVQVIALPIHLTYDYGNEIIHTRHRSERGFTFQCLYESFKINFFQTWPSGKYCHVHPEFWQIKKCFSIIQLLVLM